MPDEGERSRGPDDLEILVAEAFTDRALRHQTYDASLDEAQLLAYLRENPPPRLSSAGLDERANFEQAEQKAEEASRTFDRWVRRRRLLRLIVITGSLGYALIGGGLAIYFAILGDWFSAVIAIAAAAGVLTIGMAGLSLTGRENSSRLRLAEKRSHEAGERAIVAERELITVLVETEVKPALRRYLNSRPSDKYRTTLTLVEQEGLAELEDPRYAIPTRTRDELDRFLDEMPGGSIGLAGPRGVGKTTLIRSVCPTVGGARWGKTPFGVVVAAPVKFDSREFLLHLFAEVCRAVLGPKLVSDLRSPEPLSRVVSRTGIDTLVMLAIIAAPVLGALLIAEAFVPWSDLTRVVLGVLLIGGGLFAAWMQRSLRERESLRSRLSARRLPLAFGRPDVRVTELELTAATQLEEIWFQQTYTSGWSGGLKAGVAEAAIEGGRELSRSQMTLPELVAELRRLLTEIAQERQVRIGIDELDKLESRDDAYRFMNEMKVLFGLENCFFLISVSEDAMSAFERRGLPFRDVFDSSFDDVIHVSYLDLDESIELLQRRVVGMPLPFIFLCHCVAGGLARDVIRVARDVIAFNPTDGAGWPIHLACQKVVETDLRAKVAATLVATRRMERSAGVERLRSWLQRLGTATVDADTLFRICNRSGPSLFASFGQEAGPDGLPMIVAAELLTFCLYSATLLEFFDDGRSPAGYRNARDKGLIEELTRARQAMSVHPHTAWESIGEFRQGMPMQSFPAAVDG
jgi:hypothetical protein